MIGLGERGDALRLAFAARVRAMPAADRKLLMYAAVVGRTFDAELLAEIVGEGISETLGRLDGACDRQILERLGKEGTTFRFRHALTRDAILNDLVARRLRPLHRGIGEALERLVVERGTPLQDLAFHWWAAGDPIRGARYNEAAGDSALIVHAEREARLYYERARDLSRERSRTRARIEAKLRSLGNRGE